MVELLLLQKLKVQLLIGHKIKDNKIYSVIGTHVH